MAEANVRQRYQATVEALEQDIADQEGAISRREDRERLLSGPFATYVDPQLPLMRRRLAQTRKELALLIDRLVLPEGLGDPGLEGEGGAARPESDPALQAVRRLVAAAAKRRALPHADPVVSEEEVEEEFERQTGAPAGKRRRVPRR